MKLIVPEETGIINVKDANVEKGIIVRDSGKLIGFVVYDKQGNVRIISLTGSYLGLSHGSLMNLVNTHNLFKFYEL